MRRLDFRAVIRYARGVLPISILSRSPQETQQAAAALAPALKPGSVLALHGDLGAGKTCFIQGLARALGVTATVNSPTYTIICEYQGRLPLYHVDLYRLDDAQEALRTGLDDYLHGDGVTAIEWAERAAPLLPAHTIHVHLRTGARPEERAIEIIEPPAA
jgi:tRNA threonylcarbamoyladenosine biosynthesis protein TsaE